MRWIVDAQLPPALAVFLCDEGHNAEHVADVGLREASDKTIWEFALKHDAIIVTKDEDFQLRASMTEGPPTIVWLRIGNCSRSALVSWFGPLLGDIEERIKNGAPLIEVR